MTVRVYAFAVYHVEEEKEEKEKNRRMYVLLTQANKTSYIFENFFP
jgi:hypothetical protein